MAAPLVTGAVALYKASRPLATPSQVRAALRAAGTRDWNTATDPDGVHPEPLLDVGRIVALGDWTVDATARAPCRSVPRGSAIQVPIYVVRAEDVNADVALSVDAPAGLAAASPRPVGADATTRGPDRRWAPRRGRQLPDHDPRTRGTQVRHARPVTLTVDGMPPVIRPPALDPVEGTTFNTSSYAATTAGPPPRIPTPSPGTSSAWQAGGSMGHGGPLVGPRTLGVREAHARRGARLCDPGAGRGCGRQRQPLDGGSALASRVVQDTSALRPDRDWHRYLYSRMSGGSTLVTRSRRAPRSRYTFTGRGIAVIALGRARPGADLGRWIAGRDRGYPPPLDVGGAASSSRGRG